MRGHEPEYCYCEYCYANLETGELNPNCPVCQVWMSATTSTTTMPSGQSTSPSGDSNQNSEDPKGPSLDKHGNRLDVSLPPERGA